MQSAWNLCPTSLSVTITLPPARVRCSFTPLSTQFTIIKLYMIVITIYCISFTSILMQIAVVCCWMLQGGDAWKTLWFDNRKDLNFVPGVVIYIYIKTFIILFSVYKCAYHLRICPEVTHYMTSINQQWTTDHFQNRNEHATTDHEMFVSIFVDHSFTCLIILSYLNMHMYLG